MAGEGIQYAKVGEVHVAHLTRGDGSRDVLFLPGGVIPLDMMGDEPRLARFLSGLERFGRLILLNRRGIGLSDPIDPSAPPTLADWVDDCVAVLEATAAHDVCVVAGLGDAKIAIALAALRPDLITHVVTVSGAVRPLWHDVDLDREELAERRTKAQLPNRDPDDGFDHLRMLAPSLGDDSAFREWWDDAGRRGASPRAAPALIGTLAEFDASEALERLTAPLLVIHPTSSPFMPLAVGQWMADHAPDGRLVALPGADLACWIDDNAVLAEIEDFLTGQRSAPAHDRKVLTVFFTDIVGSTEEAVRRGDREWRALLEHHDAGTRRVVERFGGRVVKSTGDGVLARFDEPAQAVRAGAALVRELHAAGTDIRVGIHTGEVELRDDDLAGLAVHIAARVEAHAQPGQVLVSRTVRDLLLGSSFTFTHRGEQPLKGLPEAWALFSLEEAGS